MVHSAIADQMLDEDYSGIPKTLYNFAKQALSNVKGSKHFLENLEKKLSTI